jgi:hypothetical protein
VAYRRGDPIAAADYNGFLTSVLNVWATGSGDSGYGQTATQSPVAQGQSIASAEWVELRRMISVMATHQGTTVNLPPANLLGVGQPITAHDPNPPSNNAFDLPGAVTVVSAVQNNRLSTSVAEAFSLVSSAHTSVRNGTWGGGSGEAATITTQVDVTFTSQNSARFFFNSGGRIRLLLNQPGSGVKDTLWNTGLTNRVGAISFGARSSSRNASTPAGSFASNLGFYGLTDSNQPLFNGTNSVGGFGKIYGAGRYTNYATYEINDVTISVRRLNFTNDGLGGNGTGLRFTISLTDDVVAGADFVAAGTTAEFGYWRASRDLLGIAAPSFATVAPF